MIKTEKLGIATHIYSDQNKKIKNLKTGHIHSEYVVLKPILDDYVEIDLIVDNSTK